MEKPDIPPVRVKFVEGFLDEIVSIPPNRMLFRGWVLSPEEEFSCVKVYVNERLAGVAEREERQDLADHFPTIPHAGRSGFTIDVDLGPIRTDPYRTVNLVGFQGDRPLGRRVFVDGLDLPPASLMKRVAGTSDGGHFKNSGYRSCIEFVEALRRHQDLASVRCLFDWGCGCGRVTAHLLRNLPGVEIHGSDIDPEAIAWCKAHLPSGKFFVSGTHPPLPFEDATFDVVLAKSVFTHLTKDLQNAWLAELRRIIVPGGLLLPTAHGEFAICSRFPSDTSILSSGFSDNTLDSALDGLAPKEYYRGTFQTKEYTYKEWSKYFDILEYVEKGSLDYQDLLVMRRPT